MRKPTKYLTEPKEVNAKITINSYTPLEKRDSYCVATVGTMGTGASVSEEASPVRKRNQEVQEEVVHTAATSDRDTPMRNSNQQHSIRKSRGESCTLTLSPQDSSDNSLKGSQECAIRSQLVSNERKVEQPASNESPMEQEPRKMETPETMDDDKTHQMRAPTTEESAEAAEPRQTTKESQPIEPTKSAKSESDANCNLAAPSQSVDVESTHSRRAGANVKLGGILSGLTVDTSKRSNKSSRRKTTKKKRGTTDSDAENVSSTNKPSRTASSPPE